MSFIWYPIREPFSILQGTDETMLDKLRANHGSCPYFLTLKSQAAKTFGIVHFAGSVYYDIRGIGLTENLVCMLSVCHSTVYN